jgi:hypothetical protein
MTNRMPKDPDEITAEEIVDEASRPDADAVHKEMDNGGDETGPNSEETPHGSEERKHEIEEEAEENDG